ncbi:MAG: Crp/Fnr family transcriptional regulator [Bacteroidales bacterium]|nr:Crp/Fnr family transcriptional regulator [Bacteroidales bacterium]
MSETFEVELLSEIMQNRIEEIDADTILLSEGSYVKKIPLLLDGSVRVRKSDESGKEIILYHIQPGESCILSITGCLNMKQSKAEAIVEDPSRMILVSAEKVREWNDKYKSWRGFVQQLYYQRLDVLLDLVDAIAFRQVDERLLDKLREFASKHGNAIPLTHQKLAAEIGSAREVVSRLLKQLEIQGIVKLDRGTIHILKPF